MRKYTLIAATVMVVFLFSGQVWGAQIETEILCCRPVCSGCGPGMDTLCDYKTRTQCLNLKGWEVEDCIDCKPTDHDEERSH
jgi:hypothetical protein